MSDFEFKVLENFCSCYLHQDWEMEFDSPDDAINTFCFKEPKENLSILLSEIDELIRCKLSEAEMETFLTNLGCYYEPRLDGLSPEGWLIKIRTLVYSKTRTQQ